MKTAMLQILEQLKHLCADPVKGCGGKNKYGSCIGRTTI